MNLLLYLAGFLLCAIVPHELGHYFVALKQGVKGRFGLHPLGFAVLFDEVPPKNVFLAGLFTGIIPTSLFLYISFKSIFFALLGGIVTQIGFSIYDLIFYFNYDKLKLEKMK